MNRCEPGVRVVVKRLPRFLTDRAASLVAVGSADALDVMLPIVRELHAAGARPGKRPG